MREAGITVCSGGIIGMGESLDDRCAMLVELAKLDPHPESVPINALVRVAGTPLESLPPVEPLELVRMIATARILMPRARVRLSAGPHRARPRGAAVLPVRGRKQHFLRGTAADDAQSGSRRRLGADPRRGLEDVGSPPVG